MARVYLEKGDSKNAIAQAENVLADYPVSADEYNSAMNVVANPEGIWILQQSNDQTLYFGTYSSFYGHNDPTGNGYYCLYISSDTYKLFSSTDTRKNLMDSVTANSSTGYYYRVTTKFGSATNFTESMVIMRASEMELIRIESLARSGSTAAAKAALYAFQKMRDPSAVISSNTGSALLSEILVERRKELYGEIGVSYLDAKRLQLPLVRTTTGHPSFGRVSLIKNDYHFLLSIPQNEIDANANINPSDQNLISN